MSDGCHLQRTKRTKQNMTCWFNSILDTWGYTLFVSVGECSNMIMSLFIPCVILSIFFGWPVPHFIQSDELYPWINSRLSMTLISTLCLGSNGRFCQVCGISCLLISHVANTKVFSFKFISPNAAYMRMNRFSIDSDNGVSPIRRQVKI